MHRPVKSAFNKDILRSIKGSGGRFIAILMIVALGTGFYAGLRMTAPDMRIAANEYYDGTELYDIRVLSTLGFSDELLAELTSIEGVEQIMPAYETDILGVVDGSQVAIRVHSLDVSAAQASDTSDGVHALSSNRDYLNRPILVSGEWPSSEGECVLSAETITRKQLSLGDTIEITEGVVDPDEVLQTRTYTIVGFVRSSYYSSSSSLGTTSIGSGTIEQYMFVPTTDFKDSSPFSNAFLTVEGARQLDAMSQTYLDVVAEVMERLEAEKPTLQDMRLNEIQEEAQGQLDEKREEFEQEKSSALTKLDEQAAQLALIKQQLEQGSGVLAQGSSPESAQAMASYQEGLAELEAARAEAEARFAETEAELADAQNEIDEIKAPEIFVMDRSKNYGAKSFDSDAGRVNQIAQVFPLMFFLVAALISLTTMTRMVEEERTLIGTYKALGYSRQRISSKYLIYAFIASVIGAVIGISTLTQLLPGVIMNAYKIMYDVPTGATPLEPGIVVLSAALGIGATCFAAWAAAITTLREKPASLMLPRTPKAGKRILLERVGFIWKRLSFSWKVTCRNLFRYKRRLAMTLIGIALCTSLLLTGFGLSNAINDIIPKQFGEIYQYNMTIALAEDSEEDEGELAGLAESDGEAVADDRTEIEKVLADPSLVNSSMRAHTENVTASGDNDDELVALLIVPEESSRFSEFRVMRDRVSQLDLTLERNSVILSEKLAHVLNLEVGDTITLSRQDAAGYATEGSYDFIVSGVMENYVRHYVIMSPELFAEVVGESPLFTTIFADATTDEAGRTQISDTLLPLNEVRTVSYNDDMIDSYEKALSSVDTIVLVLIIAAAALAFVVLYNLTNINITERQREIATLKVLGFSKREMSSYVFREMIILTILGAALGLIFGIFMEASVVTTAEIDAVMFGREIHPLSFVIAFAMTVLFSLLIAFFMRGKLNRINMVESLKSNE